MKKFFALMLAVLMLVTSVVSLTSCSTGEKLVAVDATDLLQEDFGIAVQKGQKDLLAAINAVVNQWVADGTMTKYVDYYTALAEYAEVGGTEPDAGSLKTSWDFGAATEVITVYTESGFAPFEFIYNNEVVGVDFAIMNQVAVNMGKKVVVKDIAFDTIPTAVKTDSGLAVGAAGMTITEDRRAEVDFSDIYFSSTLVIVAAENSGITSVADLAGKRVGVQEGTSGDLIISDAVEKGYVYDTEDDAGETVTVTVKAEGAVVTQYKQYALALADLKAGRIDAILMDKLPAQTMLATAE